MREGHLRKGEVCHRLPRVIPGIMLSDGGKRWELEALELDGCARRIALGIWLRSAQKDGMAKNLKKSLKISPEVG